MRRTGEENKAKKIFKRTALLEERNKFRCTLYYIVIDGLTSIKHCNNIAEQIRFLLIRARVPLHHVLEIKYPYNDSFDAAVLYFKNSTLKNETR